jgi:HD-like signal output (HDOD) protein
VSNFSEKRQIAHRNTVRQTVPATGEARDPVDRLRPFSPVLVRLLQCLFGENASFAEIGRLLSTDPVLSAKVLSVANSGLLGRSTSTTSVLHACAVIGTDRLCGLIVSSALRTVLPGDASLPVRHWWRHSLATAYIAEEVSGGDNDGQAYTSGLLHALGQLAIIVSDLPRFEHFCTACAAEKLDAAAAESTHLGFSTETVSRALIARWNLPTVLNLTMGHFDGTNPPGAARSRVLNACAMAELLGFSAYPSSRMLNPATLPDQVARWMKDELLLHRVCERVNMVECLLTQTGKPGQ